MKLINIIIPSTIMTSFQYGQCSWCYNLYFMSFNYLYKYKVYQTLFVMYLNAFKWNRDQHHISYHKIVTSLRDDQSSWSLMTFDIFCMYYITCQPLSGMFRIPTSNRGSAPYFISNCDVTSRRPMIIELTHFTTFNIFTYLLILNWNEYFSVVAT